MKTILNCAFCLILFSLQLPVAVAQRDATVFHIEARLVEVYATVFDHRGHFVDGLPVDAFHVSENGQPQQIRHFESDSQAIRCAILLDTTGSMGSALPHLKNSVVTFIDELGPEDSVAIYTFAQQLVIQQDFTKDKTAAKRAALGLRAGGRTALYDALSEAAQAMNDQPGKKVMVVFTDGDDNASVLTAQQAVNRARSNGVPLFTIAEGEALQSPQFKKILGQLSTSTGGSTFEAKDAKGMDSVFEQISGELRHMYLLSYKPPSEPADGKWRKIDVTVDRVEGDRIRAKEGYFPN
jgi:Ca-activated chloride channel family protein